MNAFFLFVCLFALMPNGGSRIEQKWIFQEVALEPVEWCALVLHVVYPKASVRSSAALCRGYFLCLPGLLSLHIRLHVDPVCSSVGCKTTVSSVPHTPSVLPSP